MIIISPAALSVKSDSSNTDSLDRSVSSRHELSPSEIAVRLRLSVNR